MINNLNATRHLIGVVLYTRSATHHLSGSSKEIAF